MASKGSNHYRIHYLQSASQIMTIRKTCLCIEYLFNSHFYIVKLGYAGVYLFSLFLLQNIDCGYSRSLDEAVLTCTHYLCFEQKYEKHQILSAENFQFLKLKKYLYIAWASFRNTCTLFKYTDIVVFHPNFVIRGTIMAVTIMAVAEMAVFFFLKFCVLLRGYTVTCGLTDQTLCMPWHLFGIHVLVLVKSSDGSNNGKYILSPPPPLFLAVNHQENMSM